MDHADNDHDSCAELLASFSEELIVPAPVVVELDWLAAKHLGPEVFAEFLADVADGALFIADLLRADYLRIRELLARYHDMRLGFVDAAVVSIVERLGETKVATLDRRHFSVIRPRHTEALELLPA